MDNQFNNLPEGENTEPTPASSPSTPSPIPSYTAPTEPTMQSYTAPRYDRYTAVNHEGTTSGQNNQPEKKKEPKTISLSSAVVTSIVVSVISSLLVVLVMVYGLNVGNMLSEETEATPSAGTTQNKNEGNGNTTNIVVDTTAQTSAEAVAQKAGPSVVGVVVTASVNHYFFGESDTSSEGSGIVYSADGHIITNYHVIQEAVESNGKVSVYLPSDTQTPLEAQVVGYDISCDLAVLKVSADNLVPIELGDSDQLKVGQTAIAIGNPGGMDFMGSVSMGIISGLDRTLQLEASSTEINLIQTDAAINPGNSGGALTDSSGKLIGVNSAKMASSDFEGMGFAIPVNDAVEIVDRIIKNVDAPKPYFGLEISTYYNSSTLQMMGYPEGVVISSVTEGSPAENAGLIRSDIITHLNGVAVTSYTQFNSEKAKYAPGDTVELTVYRRGNTYTVSIQLGTANE